MRELLLRRRQLLIRREEKDVRAVCFKADGDQTVSITKSNTTPPTITMQYSYDGTSWNDWDLSALSFGGSKKVYVRGVNNKRFASGLYACNTFTFSTSAFVYVSGIVETLLDWETEIPSYKTDFVFGRLFYNQTALRSAKGLVFSSSNITRYAYYSMFYRCTNLLDGPESLPATLTGTYNCYQMFEGCSRLTTAPDLPATTLTDFCYERMFYGCRSLTAAPELPATTLVQECYYYMFCGCTKLNYIKCRAKVTASRATSFWLYNVATSGTFYGYSEYKWTSGSGSTIPSGWTFIKLTD